MTVTHESGHIVGGLLSGARLRDANLLPWYLPFSIFEPDPRPLVTLWSGPLLGVLVPLAASSLARNSSMWFISHFCTLANGTYLAAGWIAGGRYLDTTRLLAEGTHPGWIAAFCALTLPFGYLGFRKECIRVLKSRPNRM